MDRMTADHLQPKGNEIPANIAEDVFAGLYALEGATGVPRGEIRRMIIQLRGLKVEWSNCFDVIL